MVAQATELAGKRLQEKDPSFEGVPPAVAYLTDQAEKNPVAFMALVGKTVPAKLDVDVTVMTEQMTELLQERRQQLAQMRREQVDERPMIDITPTENHDDPEHTTGRAEVHNSSEGGASRAKERPARRRMKR
jgi:hypothetical protein